MSGRNLFSIGILTTALLLCFGAYGQSGSTGAIGGAVLDSKGAPIAAAQVEIRVAGSSTTVRTVFADGSGNFTVASLPVNAYDVVVTAKGFSTSKYNSVIVRLTETTRLNPSLSSVQNPGTGETAGTGQQVEKVTVVSAPPVVTVETSSPATGRTVEPDVIRSLPLATQNFHQLLNLSTGAISNLNASAELGRGDVGINVNGQRDDNNNYLLDGISVTDLRNSELFNTPLPSPDAVQEFKVQTSLYDATEGRNGGGNINAVLKSGTPQWHGSAFEFFRNDALNANEFFLKREGQPRPEVRQNLFGGSTGGPLGREGKGGFVFLNYQGTRQISGLSPGAIISTVIPALPSDRSAASLSMAGFGDTVHPIDPVVLALLNVKNNQFGGAGGGWLIPSLPPSDPLNPMARAVFNLSHPGRFNDDQATANYDHQFKDGRDKIAGRFFLSNFHSYLPFGAGDVPSTPGESLTYGDLSFPVELPVRNRFLSLTETHVFGPRVVNEFRFGFLDLRSQTSNQDPVTASQLSIVRPSNNVTNEIYRFDVLGVGIGPNDSANMSQAQHNYTWEDTISYSLGKHFLRFGGLYTHTGMDRDFPQDFNGLLYFNSLQTFLLGVPSYAFDASGVSNHRFLLNDYATYFQDDYKVVRNLTVNLGLRWDLMSAPQDALHHMANVTPGLMALNENPFVYPKSVNAFNIPGLVGTTSETGRTNSYASNWGPRFGFAYDFMGKHTTSLRAGYGIYYERESLALAEQMGGQAPFSPNVTAFGAPGQLATLFNGLLPQGGVVDPNFVPQPSHLVGFIDPTNRHPTTDPNMYPIFSGGTHSTYSETAMSAPQHYVSPSTQQWNLSIQRSLPGAWVMDIGYVGTKGTHLSAMLDPMQAQLASPQNPIVVQDVFGSTYNITQNTQLNVGARSPVLGLNPRGYFLYNNAATSRYNSLQATLVHQFAKGFHFQGAYTFSKSIDSVVTTGAGVYQFPLNDQTRLTQALSDFDRTHRLVLSYRYDAPFFSHARGWQSAVLGHWSLSGITVLQSGLPIRVTDSAGASAYGTAVPDTATPSLAPGYTIASAQTSGSIEQRINGYLKPAAFVPAPVVGIDGSTGFGTLGRNPFRGPFQQNWDMSLAKNWTVREGQSVKFSADMFNVWNHPIFDKPSITDIENPSFGQITNTVGTPRLVQFSLHYAF